MASRRKVEIFITVTSSRSLSRLKSIFSNKVSELSGIDWLDNWCVGVRDADTKEAGRTVRAKRPVQQTQPAISLAIEFIQSRPCSSLDIYTVQDFIKWLREKQQAGA